MARRVSSLLEESFLAEEGPPARGAGWDARPNVLELKMPSLEGYCRIALLRALCAVRSYCRRVLGQEVEGIRCFEERGPRSWVIYRVEARTGGGKCLVFWISADGQIIRFPPGKRRWV